MIFIYFEVFNRIFNLNIKNKIIMDRILKTIENSN